MGSDLPFFDLALLRPPPEVAQYDDLSEADIIVRLEQWKEQTVVEMTRLRDSLRLQTDLTLQEHASVIFTAAGFDGEEPWILESSREIARDILEPYATPRDDILEAVLRDHVKPIFRPNPHPSFNLETGRKIPRAMGHFDHFEGQEWKRHPEVSNVLGWCIRHAPSNAVEKMWHLIVPPVMTLLDDYQAAYKLRGILLVTQLLDHTTPDLLRRTGVDGLIVASLKMALTFMQHPETPALIRTGVPAYLKLVGLTAPQGSAARFDQTCALLGESIIGNIWVYASGDANTIQATLDVLPEIVAFLSIGTARYLKALVPQLTHPLIPAPGNASSTAFKLSSVKALYAVIEACSTRMHKWRVTIMDAVFRCWVDLADSGAKDSDSEYLRQKLLSVCFALVTACASDAPALTSEFDRILALNPTIFAGIVQPALERLRLSKGASS